MIDDDENDALLVRQMAGKMPAPGCHIHWAGSYDQGLKALGEIGWDLCLVDYLLGARNGLHLVFEARTRGIDCPFLLLTGAGSRAIDLQAMRAGVMGYLEKSRLCPLELERAIRYAIGARRGREPSAGSAGGQVPAEAAEFLTASYASGLPFVVIALALDREAILRGRLGAGYAAAVNAGLEALVRARIVSGDALFRPNEDALLLVSISREPREGRQFLELLLSQPLAVPVGERSQTVSLPAILRSEVFSSSGYLRPAALVAGLEAFFAPRPRAEFGASPIPAEPVGIEAGGATDLP
jgi:DNA-binding NarL/FixJ family response regulator